VLVVSEELDELFEISDRLHVVAKGRLSPSVDRADATVQQIGEWMSGLWDARCRLARSERGPGMIKLEQRPQASRWWTYGSPLLALAITVLIGVACSAAGQGPGQGLQAFFWEPLKTATPGRAGCQGHAAAADRAGAGRVLSLQCLEHRRRRAVRDRRRGCRRRGPAGRQDHRALDRAGHPAGRHAGRHGLGGHRGLAARPLQRQRDPGQPDAGLCGTLVLGYLVYGPWKDPMGYNFPQTKSSSASRRFPAGAGHAHEHRRRCWPGWAGLLWVFLFRTVRALPCRWAAWRRRRRAMPAFPRAGAVDGAADLRRLRRPGGALEVAGPWASSRPMCRPATALRPSSWPLWGACIRWA
jgi:simple sugar transport system permease protein